MFTATDPAVEMLVFVPAAIPAFSSLPKLTVKLQYTGLVPDDWRASSIAENNEQSHLHNAVPQL